MAFDPDKYFYYDTKQIVRIQDRWLGFTLYFLYFILGSYITLGVFVYGEGYLSFDQTAGGIATHVKGDTVAMSTNRQGIRYFSAEEITYPGLENGNVFVATREKVQQQVRGTCDDNTMKCESDADCTAALGGKCSEHGYCNEPSWCPKEGEDPEMYDLDTMDIQIWIKSFVHFSLLDRMSSRDPFLEMTPGEGLRPPFIYSTSNQNHTGPERGYNLFSVGELLQKCKPVPVRYEEIAQLGAVIEVVFSWKCHMQNKGCSPEIKARRLDVLLDAEKIGFSYSWSDYVSDDERVLHTMKGVRIFFRTVGRGSMLDSNAFIMKFATTTSLLCVAPIIADLFMLHLFKHRFRYRARKLIETPNFSTYMSNVRTRKDAIDRVNAPEDDAELERRQEEFNLRLREERDDE